MLERESNNQINNSKMQKFGEIIRRPEFAILEELSESEAELTVWKINNPEKCARLETLDRLLYEALGIAEWER